MIYIECAFTLHPIAFSPHAHHNQNGRYDRIAGLEFCNKEESGIGADQTVTDIAGEVRVEG